MSTESKENVDKWLEKWHKRFHEPTRGQSNNWKREYYNEHAKILAARNPNYSLKSSAPVQEHSEPAAAPASKATPKPLTKEQAIEIARHPGAFFRKMKLHTALSRAKKAHHGGRRTRRRHTKHLHTRKN